MNDNVNLIFKWLLEALRSKAKGNTGAHTKKANIISKIIHRFENKNYTKQIILGKPYLIFNISELVKDSGCSLNTVKNALKTAENMGIIEFHSFRKGEYHVSVDNMRIKEIENEVREQNKKSANKKSLDGFLKVTNHTLVATGLDHTAATVFNAVVHYFKKGKYLSKRDFANITGYSEPTVYAAFKKLEKLGLITADLVPTDVIDVYTNQKGVTYSFRRKKYEIQPTSRFRSIFNSCELFYSKLINTGIKAYKRWFSASFAVPL